MDTSTLDDNDCATRVLTLLLTTRHWLLICARIARQSPYLPRPRPYPSLPLALILLSSYYLSFRSSPPPKKKGKIMTAPTFPAPSHQKSKQKSTATAIQRAPTKGTASTNGIGGSGCTHTFDAWRSFASSYAAQRSVSDKYGVDFRFHPEPSSREKRTLSMLEVAAGCLGAARVKRSAELFDYVRLVLLISILYCFIEDNNFRLKMQLRAR